MIHLDPSSTALVLIDLQKGILGRELHPHPAAGIVARSLTAAARFRKAGAAVVLVHVKWSADMGDAPPRNVDEPMVRPEGGLPEGFAQFADGLEQAGDIVVTKRQWGAFFGTDLDLQLRRRGIGTLVLGGVATNFGVESTARSAWEHGYDVVLAEDLTATMSQEMHDFPLRYIFPRISRIAASSEIELASTGRSRLA